jgi:hypothetical protein
MFPACVKLYFEVLETLREARLGKVTYDPDEREI